MSLKQKHLLGKAQRALNAKDYPLAGALFEEAATLSPAAHQAWFGLGEVAQGIGQQDTAATFFGHAAELQPENARYRLKFGEALALLGQIPEALQQLAAARQRAGKNEGFLCGLSGAYVKAGNWQHARQVLEDVVRLPRPLAAHYCLLGLACQRLGELDDALKAFGKATKLDPRYPDSWLSLGHLHIEKNEKDNAAACLKKLQALSPTVSSTFDLAGEIAWMRGDTREAANFFRQAADSAPDDRAIQAKLAGTLIMCGEALAAIDAMERAHALGISEDWILEKLGAMFAVKHWTPMARENLEMAVERNPDNLSAWNTLLIVYAKDGESEKVRKAADSILQKEPDNIYALMNLATWHNDQGRHDEALELLARARKKDPFAPGGYTKALWTMVSASSVSAADILQLARDYDEHVFRPLFRGNNFAARNRDAERRLRVGWLSSDLRHHPVAAFIQPFLEHIDPEKLETFIYYNFSEEDAISAQIKACARQWRVVNGIGDDGLADLIEGDEIDILIDLNGYTDGSRSNVIARKPAPIQATWLGFPGTSGMSTMDYIFVPPDPVLEKPDWSQETPWPLPDCYGARADISSAAILPGLPCERDSAPFTFACFNHFRKASVKTIELWSRILVRCPHARLILVALGGRDDETLRYFSSQFERHGVNPAQLEFRGYVAKQKYYESHNEIDLGLDPFPYNGGTTGYDSIWMGVPFVTWPGEHLSARMGKAILENVGLRELVAQSADDYVNIAVALANDHERLKRLRENLRERMLASPLLDGKRMAHSLENAFREMWRRWCAATQAAGEGNVRPASSGV
ncbi:MAG: tetratricopeptide repeat protein [Azoarcus sp.]|jgi:predicted O-linked N-acetylglucosamine transferase (SPINDLY family)/TolA-binding protein|nr:tetratricopeptide repeat protein [Azoarcus sp.]